MDSLNKDVLFNIATMLDLDELLNFCSSDSRINRLICQREAIWLFKLAKEFPDYKSNINQRGREAYELLVGLSKLKTWMKYRGTIYNLYKETQLYFDSNNIKILPPEIGKLSNLHILWLSNNKIKILPPEIGNLSNLQALWLNSNQIEILPPEIGKLSNLQELYLYNNQIRTLPSEMVSLINLKGVWLDKKVTIPSELKHLPIRYN